MKDSVGNNSVPSMGSSERKRLNDFLSHFIQQRDLGLLIVRSEAVSAVQHYITECLRIVAVSTSQELSSALRYQLSALILLNGRTQRMLLRDIKQCAVRSGALQTIDEDSGEVVTIEYNPQRAHILLIVSTEELQAVCEKFSIQHYVGFIEHF